jgi:hypothetical protein
VLVNSDTNLNSTIIFGGDSLSSDTTMAMVCSMLNNGFSVELKENVTRICPGGPQYMIDEPFMTKYCNHESVPGWMHLRLIRSSNDHELSSVLDLVFFELSPGVGERYERILTESNLPESLGYKLNRGLVIYNWAVHCNDVACLNQYFKEITSHLVDLQKKGFTLFWKVHEAQHFDTLDHSGVYGTTHLVSNKCSAIHNYSQSNWRNNVARLFFHNHTLPYLTNNHSTTWNQTVAASNLELAYVPIVPYFNDSYRWNWMKLNTAFWDCPPYWKKPHAGPCSNPDRRWDDSGDCTHFCYVPGRFSILWENIYRTLHIYMHSERT